jgi:hypothetical protein
MSEYEKINARSKEQVVRMRREAFKRIALLMAKVLAALGAIIGLEAIDFISVIFMVILMVITVCIGAFNTGWICRDIKF